MIIRFSGFRISDIDSNLLITGTTVAFSIIISSIILNYVLFKKHGSMSILEVFLLDNLKWCTSFNIFTSLQIVLDFFGILLFIASGAVSIFASQNQSGIITALDKYVGNFSEIVGGLTGWDGLDNIFNGAKGILGLEDHNQNTAMGAFIAIGIMYSISTLHSIICICYRCCFLPNCRCFHHRFYNEDEKYKIQFKMTFDVKRQ